MSGLRGDTGGTAALEFAIVAPVLLLMIIWTLEAGYAMWTWQALQATAIEAARCAGINSISCKNVGTTPSYTQTYAQSAAQALGLSGIAASNITITTGATAQAACATSASVVSVVVSYTLSSGLLPPLPTSLSASACFPLASTS